MFRATKATPNPTWHIQWSDPRCVYDPPHGNHYSNPPRSSAARQADPQSFYFWLGEKAEGFHART